MPNVPRLFDGQTVVCLASGPSLTREDCAFVQGKAPVVAVNDAVLLAPWADVLVSVDRQWWRMRNPRDFAGLKFGVGSSVGKRNAITTSITIPGGRSRDCSDVTVLWNRGVDGIASSPDGLCHGRNSGHGAINLAVHLGARRILLLGYNMGAPTGRRHFEGAPGGLRDEAFLYQAFRRAMATTVEPLQALGVDVVNCTENTSLVTFPVRALRDVLTEKAVAA